MAKARIDYVFGDKVGFFTFVADDGVHIKVGGSKTRKAIFMCECGNKISKPIYIIKSGRIKSCGCKREELLQNARTHHGMSKHPLMKRWDAMIGRCYRPATKQYKNYGGRGISVCDEWRNSFISFYNWALSSGYSIELSIDRINVDGNYEPSNCRWATKTVQQRNTRRISSCNTSGYRGVCFHKQTKKWRASITMNDKTIHLGLYNSKEEASVAYDNYITKHSLEHTKNCAWG